MVSVDLNADLGESFGTWQLGDDDAMLGLVTSANVACGFHAGDPTTLRHSCEEAAKQRRPDRRAGRLPRPRRVRQALHRHHARRPHRRRHLPDRCAAGARPRGRVVGHIRQTPWRAVQHDRQQPRPGPRGRRGGARRRPESAGARIGGVGVLRRGGAARACAPCPRRSPTGPIGPTGSSSPGGNATPCCTTPPRSPTGWRRWCSRDGSSPSTDRRSRSPSNPFVCMVIRREPCRSPPRCGTGWLADGVELAAFV